MDPGTRNGGFKTRFPNLNSKRNHKPKQKPWRALVDGSIRKHAEIGKDLRGGFPRTQGQLNAGCVSGPHGRGICDVTDTAGPAGFGLRILSPYVTRAGLTKVTMRVCVTKARSLDSDLGVSPGFLTPEPRGSQARQARRHFPNSLASQCGHVTCPSPVGHERA